MSKKETISDAVSGEKVVVDAATGKPFAEQGSGPKRSWYDDDEEGKKDFSFEFEGSIIHCRYAKNWNEIKEVQSELLDVAQEIEAESQALKDVTGKPDSMPEVKRISGKLESLTLISDQKNTSLARKVVANCVIGWENAPKPYSEENKAALKTGLVTEWAQIIVNNSRLSKAEARFPDQPV